MAISHSSGMFEVWLMEHINSELPRPYKIYYNFCDSDFLFYYDCYWMSMVTLHSIKSEYYKVTKRWDTELIIQNIDKDKPYFRQQIDIDAR